MAKILIIGESKYILSNIISSLQTLGHQTLIAKTNSEGLAIIDKHYEHFDLIILDKQVEPLPQIALITNFLVATKLVIGQVMRSNPSDLKPLYCYATNSAKIRDYDNIAKLGIR